MRLTKVKRFWVPRSIITKTEDNLREAGVSGYEMFILWSGTLHHGDFRFRTAHAPRQTAYRTHDGLSVKVAGPALHRLNRWLLEHDEILAAQVHAHPTDAFHSDTDDTYPIVTARGGLSLVAADFARDGLLTKSSAVFRLGDHGWMKVPDPGQLITVTHHGAG